MKTRMQAAILESPTAFAVRNVDAPRPGAKQAVIRLEGCGVCGSNLAPWEGRPWFKYPIDAGAPGHEGWGHVEEIGEGVSSVRRGDRVAFLSQRAFGEMDLADESAIVPLPTSLKNTPFPGEAIGCAVNVFRRSQIKAGESVAVVGAGFLGSLIIGLAASNGANVVAISRREESLDRAKIMGATETIQWSDQNAASGRSFDVVIEAVGNQEALDLATNLTRERGRLIIAGYHQDGPRTVNMQLWNWRGLDVINAHERDASVYVQGIREAVEAVASGKLNLTPLLTHRYSLDQINRAFQAMRDREPGFCKAVITL
jgi:2-desacetyl-2-hydroxyethyl bacteriochlorophyllide A dehydrogenase